MKILMFYELSEDGLSKVPANMGAHQARLREFHGRGLLLMAGPYGAPPVGALGVHLSRGGGGVRARRSLHAQWRRGQVHLPRVERSAGLRSRTGE
jgi:uncharacterized protein